MKNEDGLRQRNSSTTTDKNNNKKSSSPSSTATPTPEASVPESMSHRRGPVLAYSRGGTVSKSRQTLSNYKNKILFALGATILYTAWLYRSGKSRLQKLK